MIKLPVMINMVSSKRLSYVHEKADFEMKSKKIISFFLAGVILGGLAFGFRLQSGNENKETIESQIDAPAETIRGEKMMKITVGDTVLEVAVESNSSTAALLARLEQGPVTISMRDYGNIEKVGNLGFNLPQNNEMMNTRAGDVILYQGNSFVIYYDTNAWSLTPIGKVSNVAPEKLKDILKGDRIIATLSL
ncbi:MAG: cyclophilin-like fold protein [Erysipelotrichaceae bacterium]|nr:cyclophilin-like fold protein [Erysipelotrichaceae bacterium]